MSSNTPPATKQISERRRKWTLCAAVVAGMTMMLVVWFIGGVLWPRYRYPDITTNSPTAHHELRGTFGDQFGAINALFSGVALVGVVVALILQRNELKQAISEHRDASRQHASIIRTEIVLRITDEIRSQEWGDAHAALTAWRREHGAEFVEAFLRERKLGPAKCEIDRHRRQFIRPLVKVYRLHTTEVIDEAFARQLISGDIAETLHHIIIPMEQGILEQIGRQPNRAVAKDPFFVFIELLHSKGNDPYSMQS